jgi:hypothetical protein
VWFLLEQLLLGEAEWLTLLHLRSVSTASSHALSAGYFGGRGLAMWRELHNLKSFRVFSAFRFLTRRPLRKLLKEMVEFFRVSLR